MAGSPSYRTVREEKSFSVEKERISRSAKRLDDVLSGIVWALCRAPESFEKVSDLGLYLIKTDAAPGIPRLRVWYTFNDTEVHLLFIEAVSSDS